MDYKNYWKNRFDENNEWIKNYAETIDHPHRKNIIGELSQQHFDSLLEIGCGMGVNLQLIEKTFNVKTEGVELNPYAVEYGKKLGLNLKVGEAENIHYEPKSFDVILTDACLIYIEPKEIKKLVKKMIRIARKKIIMVEWYSPSKTGKLIEDHWARDYEKLFADYGIKCTKKKIKWEEKNWKKLGFIFVAHLQ